MVLQRMWGILLLGLSVSGCYGMVPGLIGGQLASAGIRMGVSGLANTLMPPSAQVTYAPPVQRVECKIIDGNEYCRPVAPMPVVVKPPISTSSPPPTEDERVVASGPACLQTGKCKPIP